MMKKKLLLIGMGFLNYEEKIIEEFERQGYRADYLTDKPADYNFKARIYPHKMLGNYLRKYQDELLNTHIKQIQYDIILVIVGRFLTRGFIEKLKGKNKDARLILYLWDDMRYVENYTEVEDLYDEIYDYAPEDCIDSRAIFLPLFFTNEFGNRKSVIKYDVFSAMMNYSDRETVLEDFCRKLETDRAVFYLNIGRYGYLKRKINQISRGKHDARIRYVAKPIPKEKSISITHQSKSVLDIPFFDQNGLTIRTFETMACNKKLITFNKSIQYYDFYSPENILVLDRESLKFDDDFFETPVEVSFKEIHRKYSLENWVKSIIQGKVGNYIKDGFDLNDLRTNS